MDGSFYWNTTVPVKDKPILVYLYNGHEVEDGHAAFSREVERGAFVDKQVVATARRFTCEKICFGCRERGLHLPHREAVTRYMSSLSGKGEARDGEIGAQVVLLDSTGQVIREFKRPPTSGVLLQAMRLAQRENRRRLEEASTTAK